jgi:hypothetical protein
MSFKTLINGIAHLPAELVDDVDGLFSKAEAAWNKLAPAVQGALKNGSGILAVINADLTGPAEPIIAAIEAKFGVQPADVTNVLQKIAAAFNIAEADSTDLPTLIGAVQKYLSGLGGVWSFISGCGAEIAADVLNGDVNPLTIGIDLMRYVYVTKVKPLITAPATAA